MNIYNILIIDNKKPHNSNQTMVDFVDDVGDRELNQNNTFCYTTCTFAAQLNLFRLD